MNSWWGNLESHQEQDGAFKTWQDWHKARFIETGLPDKKQEAWRYMPFQQMAAVQYASKPRKPKFYACPLQLEHAIVIQIQGETIQLLHDPIDGLEILSLKDAFSKYPTECQSLLNHTARTEDGFLNLNAANLHTGLWIRVKEGHHIAAPIIIHHQAQAGIISHFRHCCVMEKNSSAQVLEYFDSAEDKAAFINHASVFSLNDCANLAHYRLQCLASHDNLQSSVQVAQEAQSTYYDFLLQIGGKISGCDLKVHLNAANAKAILAGVFQAQEQQFHQQRVHVFHEKEHGHSEQLYRGVLDDKSRGVFIGEVYVAPHAIKTEAHQSNKNLLLAPMAEMISCPQLQIFADDVICSHGATVGQLEEDAIFYLQTRGIGQDAAKSFLTKAFYHEPLMSIQHEALRAWCVARLADRG